MKKLNIIVAVDKNNWIWKGWELPWHISADLKYFKSMTSTSPDESKLNALIMGRNTWQSIPYTYRPLSGRLNIVLSRNKLELPWWVLSFNNLNAAVEYCNSALNLNKIFVIWWWMLYEEAMKSGNIEKLYITEIESKYNCDTFFPNFRTDGFEISKKWELMTEKSVSFRFNEYRPKL